MRLLGFEEPCRHGSPSVTTGRGSGTGDGVDNMPRQLLSTTSHFPQSCVGSGGIDLAHFSNVMTRSWAKFYLTFTRLFEGRSTKHDPPEKCPGKSAAALLYDNDSIPHDVSR